MSHCASAALQPALQPQVASTLQLRVRNVPTSCMCRPSVGHCLPLAQVTVLASLSGLLQRRGWRRGRVPCRGQAAGRGHRRWRLFTAEDKNRLHAVLGFACLVHIVIRLGLLISGVPDMGFGGDWVTLACISMHALLGVSSFKFQVPVRRSKHGTQIWQEYRAHNAIFTLRAIVAMLCAWVEVRYGVGRLWYVRVAALFAAMLAADAVTQKHSLPATTLAGAMSENLRAFLASFQFIASTSLLFSNGFWQQFCSVLSIQITAFVLTLNRRRMITAKQVIALYAGLILVLQPALILEQFKVKDMAIPFWGTVATGLRIGLRLDKYAMWAAMVAAMTIWNPHLLYEGAGAGFRIWLPGR